MSHDWPGDWHSKAPQDDKGPLPAGERTGPSFTNDNGIRCLLGETDEAYLFMDGDVPENRC